VIHSEKIVSFEKILEGVAAVRFDPLLKGSYAGDITKQHAHLKENCAK